MIWTYTVILIIFISLILLHPLGEYIPHPYYLQLQGNKIARAFITFIKRKKLNAQQIKRLEQTIQKHFPDISKNHFLSNHIPEETLADTFHKNNRGLFNLYIKSFFKFDDIHPNSYPLSDVQAQLRLVSY